MDVKHAIDAATEAVKRLFPGDGYRLEEVEYHDDDYAITISYWPQDGETLRDVRSTGGDIAGYEQKILGVDPFRDYKEVLVDRSGLVKSVKIRQIVLN